MKNLCFAFLSLLILSSCGQQRSDDFISISGQLTNNKDSILSISDRQGVIKKIKINSDGSFKDTLSVERGAIYNLYTSAYNRAPIFLKNGYNLSLKIDATNFMNSIDFSGTGSSNSNFIISQIKQSQKIGNPEDIINLEVTAFKAKIKQLRFEYDSILNAYQGLDSTLYTSMKQQNEQLFAYLQNVFEQNLTMGKGKPSPTFENYMDIKGGTKSLNSFKGKYVYIDVWATWCGPCIQQIPYLQTLEKEYHNKNIEFVSISTDEARRNGGSWEAAEKKWRDFVKKRNMGGTQLWSGQDYSFQQAYQINGIPRFILIDPKGNIVDANAPRPSDPSLKSLFTSLGI